MAAEPVLMTDTPKKSGAGKWILGCGIGCGALLLIAIIIVVFLIIAARKGLDEVGKEIARTYPPQYQSHKSTGKIPADYVELTDKLFAVTQNPDASTWATFLAIAAIEAPIEDRQITEDEAALMQTIADELTANPGMSFFDAYAFGASHPELQRQLQRLQEQAEGASQAPPPAATPLEESMEEPPAPTPAPAAETAPVQ